MSGDAPPAHDKGPLLGQQVAGSAYYDPELLFPVPRSNARQSLPDGHFRGFGEDIWHAYELSWLDTVGMPQVFLGTFGVPATSANIIESKSFKLYLNSLNNHRFASTEVARQTIVSDLSDVADATVSLSLCSAEDSAFQGARLAGSCLDDLQVSVPDSADPDLLAGAVGDGVLYTHLMRSLCPVTAQPDWATLVVETCGVTPDKEGLLRYLLAYRNHQEFHEQCVERIYTDIQDQLQPDYLSVHALYTRRGGLDISPWRCSESKPAPRYRLSRQ